MKLLRGVSVQLKGLRSTTPRYFTVTLSALADAEINNDRAARLLIAFRFISGYRIFEVVLSGLQGLKFARAVVVSIAARHAVCIEL